MRAERNTRAMIITVMTKDRGASGSAESNAGCIDNAESGNIPRPPPKLHVTLLARDSPTTAAPCVATSGINKSKFITVFN